MNCYSFMIFLICFYKYINTWLIIMLSTFLFITSYVDIFTKANCTLTLLQFTRNAVRLDDQHKSFNYTFIIWYILADITDLIFCEWFKSCYLGPTKIHAGHLVKMHIERSIKIAQSLKYQWIYVRMISTFSFSQTMWSGMTFTFE